MQLKKSIDPASKEMMSADSKIGVLGTTDDEGYPHLTFISSLQSRGDRQLTWGQFSAGLSKRFLPERPNAGFLILSADKRFLSGLATYTHTVNTGDVFEAYNKKPLFRYNCYMGFSKVFFMDLIGITPLSSLPMPAIITGAILSRIKACFLRRSEKGALPTLAQRLFKQLDSLKFLAFTDDDGHLIIFPIVQATAAGSDRIVFTRFPYRETFEAIPDGCKAAILCVTLDMESVLVKGVCRAGMLEIERVYNSMPPKMEYVYPREKELLPVTVFNPS